MELNRAVRSPPALLPFMARITARETEDGILAIAKWTGHPVPFAELAAELERRKAGAGRGMSLRDRPRRRVLRHQPSVAASGMDS